MTIKAKKSKINLREKLAELLNFRQIRDRLDGLGLYLGKDRTGSAENVAVRGGANVDDLQLAEISAILGDDAVDVFVYDTSKDSDGGKWRERTQHTSWYNEELNTATRGSRREFPAVAVIIAEINKVTIYDGDDPDLPMWMVFPSTSSLLTSGSTTSNLSLYALNGDLVFGNSSTYYGALRINFITERIIGYHDSTSFFGLYKYNISQRSLSNGTSDFVGDSSTFAIVNRRANDVAMTVLPNAPIDDDTGLPVPTIAVATDGGVSVIRDDGSVVDIGYTAQTIESLWLKQNRIWITAGNGALIVGDIPDTDKSSNAASTLSSLINGWNAFANTNEILSTLGSTDTLTHGEAFGSDQGLNLIYEEKSNPASSLVAYTTSSYNTGWMPGDIKLATLSDTKVEKVGVDESISASLISNGENWTGASGSTPPTDWSQYGSGANDAIYSISGGELTITENGSGNYGIMYQAFDVVAGQTYTVTVRYKSSGTGFARFFIGTGPGSALILSTQNTGSTDFITKSITFSDTNSRTLYLSFAAVGEEGASAIFDYVSITKTGELITNGTFDNGIEGWDKYNCEYSVDANGRLKIDDSAGAGSWSGAVQEISTIIGKRYILSVECFSESDGFSIGYYNGSYPSAGTALSNYIIQSSDGSYKVEFIATNSITSIFIGVNNSGVSYFDNLSVRLAEDDRSVNNNGLQIFGEIDKTPVAPGADLVAYSGFSADNYLMQPYNPDLDFGTGDFSIITWVNKNSTATQVMLNSGDGSSSRLYLYISGTNELRFAAGGTGTNVYGSIGSDSIWNQITIVRKDGIVYGYINGVFQASYSNSNAVTHSLNDTLKIGSNTGGAYPFGGSLSLIRFTATSITPDQIDKIYRDEKALFTDGAQATLYGTDDAVTALAYDDKTELLHVGTSDGRSDFAGLRRINNTTTAVTTSISASNNLIAEQ